MNIPYSHIKAEMQGPQGLIKKVRDEFLPSGVEMASLAQFELEKIKDFNFSDIDNSLNQLLLLEYKIFLDKQDQITDNFISYADKVVTSSNFPNIRAIIDDFNTEVSKGGNPINALSSISKMYIALADSNRQSRVSRAGTSLMEHIAYLLEKSGLIFGIDFQREIVIAESCKVDFLFPDLVTFKKSPENCFAVACQTTSNDRFRLSIAQMPQLENSRNRACTAIGNENFGIKLGPKSLTENKLNEAKRNNVKFVIIGSSINQRLKDTNVVMSYNDFFAELKHFKKLWS